jgi:hypothetical protein
MANSGVLWRIKTHRNIRTLLSLPTNTGPRRLVVESPGGGWSRLQETDHLIVEKKRTCCELRAPRSVLGNLRSRRRIGRE